MASENPTLALPAAGVARAVLGGPSRLNVGSIGLVMVLHSSGLVLFLLRVVNGRQCRLFNTHTLMLQDLCPSLSPPSRRPSSPGAAVRTCLGLLAGVLICASAQASSGVTTLLSQAQQWIAQAQGTTPDRINMQAIDRRIDVPACPKGWTFEAPFAGQPSVRASCDSPKAQLFVQWKSPRLTATLVPSRVAPVPAPAKTALAASRTLPRGSHLESSMVQWIEVPASQWSAHHLSDMSVLNGSELMRDMVPGQIIRRQDIRPSVLVKKGQMVSFQVGQSTDFMIVATVQALQDGRMGEQIRLKNPDSGRILSGMVTGLNVVKTP